MADDDSASLFRVHIRPVVALATLSAGLLLVLISADGLFFKTIFAVELHIVFTGLLWILFIIGLITTIVGIKQIIRPVLMFEVTESGIVQRMRAGIAVETGQLIPWDRIESMRLDEHAGYHGRRSRIIVIAVKLRMDDEWPKERLYNFDDAQGSVMLDAFSGRPAGQRLLRRLEEARARSAGSA